MTRMNYDGRRRRELAQLSKQQRRDHKSYAAELKTRLRELRPLEARVRDIEARERDLEARERDVEARERKLTRLAWRKKLGVYSSR